MAAQEIVDILAALNESGGIPVKMVTVAQTEGTQFGIYVALSLFSSFMVVLFMWQWIQPALSSIASVVTLRRVKHALGRHVVVIKHTQSGIFDLSMIDLKTMMKVEKAMKKFNGKPFDLILHTPGGTIFATQALVRAIIRYPGQVRAVVPFYAMSGGTMLALACDGIVMGETACLGPVDPQLGSIFHVGSAKSWQRVIQKKGRKADDASIQMAFMGEQYEQTVTMMVDKMLALTIPDAEQRATAVTSLTAGEIEHAYPLTIDELDGLGIPTAPLDFRVRSMLVNLMQSNFYEGVYYA